MLRFTTVAKWLRIDYVMDAFFAFRSGGLRAFRRVLQEIRTYPYHARSPKIRSIPPTVEQLEPRLNPSGTAPTAVADLYYLNHSQGYYAGGVLSNDTDPESDSLTASVVSGPSHGSFTYFHSDGSFEYVPTTGYVGSDSFTYTANDGTSDSNTATVNLNITNRTLTWDAGGSDDNMSTAANWSDNVLPVAGDTIQFNSSCTDAAVLDSGFLSHIANFTVADGYSGSITLDRAFTVDEIMTLYGGSYTLNADLTIDSDASLVVGVNFCNC